MIAPAKPRVLYIEDDVSIGELFSAAVGARGFEVDVAISGQRAIALHQENPYDIVVVDYQLPEMTGLDIAAQMLAQDPELQIIMLTEIGSEHVASQALMLGVTNYVVKSNPNVIVDLVPELIEKANDHRTEKRQSRDAMAKLEAIEKRFTRGLAYANVGTWEWNIVNGELYWSERIPHLFGYSDGSLETTYDNFLAAVHPDDRQAVIDAVNACVEDGADYNIEHRVVWPDGTVRWLHESGDTDRLKDGTALKMFGVVRDITVRRQAETALAEREQQLHSTFKNAVSGMINIDARGIIKMVNPAAGKIFGYGGRELIGKNVSVLMPEPDHSSHDGYLSAYLNTGKAKIIGIGREVTGRRKDGREFPMLLGVSQTVSNDQVLFSGVIVDISAQKNAEDALQKAHDELELRVAERTRELSQAKERAESSDRAKDEFLSHMSHELRTPLNAILGFSELMKSETLGPLNKENYGTYIDHIYGSGNLLLSIVSSILDVVEIMSDDFTLTDEQVDLETTMSYCLASLAQLADEADVEVFVEIEDGLPMLTATESRIKQMCANLISNSIRFNQSGGQVNVICALNDEGGIVITIKDAGIGISKSEIERVQRTFELGRPSLLGGSSGIGSGLPIARRIAERHQATFLIESVIDKGTTVTITFPKERTLRVD